MVALLTIKTAMISLSTQTKRSDLSERLHWQNRISLFASGFSCAPRRVDGVPQVLARLEADIFRGRNVDFLVRARIASFARLALRNVEAAQPGNRAALAALT